VIDATAILGGGYDTETAVRRWLNYRAGSYIPSIFGLLNTDDSLKEARSMLDGFRSRIPGLSETVESKRDNFGQKMIAPMGYPYNQINPFAHTTTSGDRVREELMRLADTHLEARFVNPPEKLDGVIDLTNIRNEDGQTAHDRWIELLGEVKLGGKTLYDSMDELMSSDAYKAAAKRTGEGDLTYRKSFAVDMVKQRFKMYHDAAFRQVRREYPEMAQAVDEYKIDDAKTRFLGPGAAREERNPLIRR
jgi:hypothetical protein